MSIVVVLDTGFEVMSAVYLLCSNEARVHLLANARVFVVDART